MKIIYHPYYKQDPQKLHKISSVQNNEHGDERTSSQKHVTSGGCCGNAAVVHVAQGCRHVLRIRGNQRHP